MQFEVALKWYCNADSPEDAAEKGMVEFAKLFSPGMLVGLEVTRIREHPMYVDVLVPTSESEA